MNYKFFNMNYKFFLRIKDKGKLDKTLVNQHSGKFSTFLKDNHFLLMDCKMNQEPKDIRYLPLRSYS